MRYQGQYVDQFRIGINFCHFFQQPEQTRAIKVISKPEEEGFATPTFQ